MKPLLFAMPGNQPMADQLGKMLSCEMGELQVHQFPDGESSLRFLSNVAGRDIGIVCTLDRPDEKILALYLAANIARELGTSRIGLLVPYLPYMRQDARFKEGEGITSAHFARLLSSCCNWLITVDPHLHRYHDLKEIYQVPTMVVRSASAISAWILQNVERPFVIGPDAESEQWVAEVARGARCPYTVLQKIRHGDRYVEVSLPQAVQLLGMTPVLVDDIVSTARTMIAATLHLHAAGLVSPVCIAVHALFAGDAYAALQAAGVARIVSCNTVAHPSNQIDLCNALAVSLQEFITL
ncbi:ribose-phosphate pyrophosphokinase [Undibacterium sp.]|uniref:ribose-phosphate pyrophosphokinase n=1 Tax=Undibacterium sp. TaxID=1914977 RepID=UPI0025FA2907|nr:ribose-phosphate pyrophosphokinase [Undibacterium sp.]